MRILLTGKSGYIAKAITERFGKDEFDLIPVSIRDKDDFNKLPTKIDVVVHAAAISDANSKSLNHIIKANFQLTKDLYLFYREQGLQHFIFLSSTKASMYDNMVLPDHNRVRILSPYAYSKAMSEVFLNKQNDSIHVSVVRPSMVYSCTPKKNMNRLLKLCDTPLPLPLSNISVIRKICHIDNLVELIIFLVNNPTDGIFTLSDEDSPTLTALIEYIRDELGRRRMLFAFPVVLKLIIKFLKPSLHQNLFVTNNLLSTSLPVDFKPVISAATGLRMMVSNFKLN